VPKLEVETMTVRPELGFVGKLTFGDAELRGALKDQPGPEEPEGPFYKVFSPDFDDQPVSVQLRRLADLAERTEEQEVTDLNLSATTEPRS